MGRDEQAPSTPEVNRRRPPYLFRPLRLGAHVATAADGGDAPDSISFCGRPSVPRRRKRCFHGRSGVASAGARTRRGWGCSRRRRGARPGAWSATLADRRQLRRRGSVASSMPGTPRVIVGRPSNGRTGRCAAFTSAHRRVGSPATIACAQIVCSGVATSWLQSGRRSA